MKKFYLAISRCFTILLVGVTSFAWSQSKTISGTVTSSDDGAGLSSVNVLEKGTTNGTVTDVNGKYSLAISDDNAVLLFSSVGYKLREVPVGAQSTIDVPMELDIAAHAEMVVVGYGSQDKKAITGAVVTLTTEDFNRGNINDPTQLLQGKVAGLSIYNKGGDPNAAAIFRVRGLTTLGSNATPLVVLDGVLGASLSVVDPNDIESITVLKDGSAAAIYGSRASSGVILVTTKKGTKNGVGVSYNTYVSAASVVKKIPVMSPAQYVAAGGNDLGSNTDWQDEVTQTAISNVHNIALSGGTDNTQFRISTNFRNINGVLKKSGFDQFNTRASLTHTALDNRLKFDVNMGMTDRKFNKSFIEALRYAALYNPTAPVRFESGDYYQAILFDNFDPVAIIDQNANEGTAFNFTYGAKVDYAIHKNLNLTVNYGRQFSNVEGREYYSSKSLFRGWNRNGLARLNSGQNKFSLAEAYGTYAKSFNRINLNVTGGYSYQEDQNQNLFVELGNFPTDELGYNAIQNSGDRISGLAANKNISSDKSPVNKIVAGFARVSVAFDNAVFLNASVRREGSTKLGKDNQWGTFPSVGVAVDLNKYLQFHSFNFLKFRAGYGVTGALPGNSGYAQDEYTYSLSGGGSVIKTRDGNPNLKWEQKTESNVGLDFSLFNSKLSGTIDMYSRNIDDFIQLQNLSGGQGGVGQQYTNSGKLKTNGLELNLNYDAVQIGEVQWTPGIVISHYKTILKEYGTDAQMFAELGAPGYHGLMVRAKIGEPVGQIWGPVFEGVEPSGAARFKDLDENGTVDTAPPAALFSGDFTTLGNGLPTVELGWTNKVVYYRLDFNVFFRAALGHSLVNSFRALYEPIDPGAINTYNRVTTNKAVAGLTRSQFSSLYVEKADFIKLDNLTIGYNFKLSGNVKSLRLYATGQNLFQITKYTGIDPDPVLQDSDLTDNGTFSDPAYIQVLAPGIDRRGNYFTARTFTFGLTVGI